jgi:hypothetical protein
MKKLIALILAGLLVPVFVFATITYDRTPTGTEINEGIPIDISLSFTTTSELDLWDGTDWWGIYFNCETEPNCSGYQEWPLPCVETSATQTNAWVGLTPPIGEWTIWTLGADTEDNCENFAGDYLGDLELDSGFAIMEVRVPIFTLPGTSVGSTTGIVGGLLDAIGPFIWAFIGIPLGFVVVRRIIKIIPK